MTVSAIEARSLQAQFDLPQPLAQINCPFAQLQPGFKRALNYFSAQKNARLMLVQTPEFINLGEWTQSLYQPHAKTPLAIDIKDSAKRIEHAETKKSEQILLNSSSNSELVIAQNLSWQNLFGLYPSELKDGSLKMDLNRYKSGLLWRADQGILAVPAEELISQRNLWHALNAIVEQQLFDWQELQHWPAHVDLCPTPIHLKLLIWGDCEILDQLLNEYPRLWDNTSVRCELAEDIDASSEHCQAWLSALFNQAQIPMPDDIELCTWLLRQSSRECEHQCYLAQDFSQLAHLLQYAQSLENGLTLENLKEAYQQLNQSCNGEQRWSLRSYRDGHIKLSLSGKTIGQINGLSVLESPGISRSFGEPLRITATVQPGDGDLSDVERKAELAGNIHAKSMMIIQGYLTRQFARDSQFPVSGTIVFEQSYHEIDGDSASLASLMVVLSALSNQPINQSFATTGAVDQMGNVLAVGGVNEKIEGFYQVCQLVDPDNRHFVILPAANLTQLNLTDELVEAVKTQKLTLYPVEHVNQAIELLFDQNAGSARSEKGILGTVEQRSRAMADIENHHHRGILSLLLQRFLKKAL
ncbi:AAA family ATPase [Celerinatantimonas sp. MCCC 1A17872]|uniref:AAA family ATPase n=1 Tax=Celerinatantimonas sp. MCCC 1A17872 TaxID=3177514 RepID=UPI0038CB9395